MKLVPRSLLWRSFLLITALVLVLVAALYAIVSNYEREPRARQLAQLVVSVVHLTQTALVTARADARHALLGELSDREGIHIYAAEPGDKAAPLPERAFLLRVHELLRERMGAETRMTLSLEGEEALFVSFRIDDDEYWLALPRERLERQLPLQLVGWVAAALLASLAVAWLIVVHLTRPLKALEAAADVIGRGGRPPPLALTGPAETVTLADAFNHMNAELARLDSDRALILAGISHDLRTPLTRLRMGIEMEVSDETSRDGMVADIEDMDRSIGQFLDFARADAGEAPESVDLPALLTDIIGQYRRRGAPVQGDLPAAVAAQLRPKGIRRAIGNLIDNALRHAGTRAPVDIVLTNPGDQAVIEVRDRGPGIPPDQADRLKLPFTRLDSARSNPLGAGLGLAIVQRIASGHGGRLDLLPRDGGGLVARLTLPIR